MPRAFLLVVALGGCAAGPVPVRLENRAATSAPATATVETLQLLPVVDRRASACVEPPESGALGPWVVTSDSVIGWVRTELNRQLSARYRLTEESAAGAGWSLQIEVRHCYLRSIGGQLSAQVVLAAAWRHGDEVRQRIVRGQRVGSVWWSLPAEAEAALRLALEDAVRQLGAVPSS